MKLLDHMIQCINGCEKPVVAQCQECGAFMCEDHVHQWIDRDENDYFQGHCYCSFCYNGVYEVNRNLDESREISC